MVGRGCPTHKCPNPKCDFEFVNEEGNYQIDLDDYRCWIWANHCPMCGENLKAMPKKEFTERMSDISKINDKEKSHPLADGLMCTVLKQLGYQEGIEIFRKMTKWYS